MNQGRSLHTGTTTASWRITRWWRRSPLEARFEVFVLVAAALTIPLVVLEELGQDGPIVVAANWLIWATFAVEYVVLLALSRDRVGYVKRRWLWLAVVVLSFPMSPALLGLSRLIRLTRLARLLRVLGVGWRGVDALRSVFGRRGLVYVAILTAVLLVVGGGVMSDLEPTTVHGGFWAGVWWAFVTVTTVGYGDIAPGTVAGRLVAVALMMSGIGLTATLAAAVAAHFVGQDDRPHVEDLSTRLRAVEAKLDILMDTLGEAHRSGRVQASHSRQDDPS